MAALSLKGLGKRFPGGVRAVRDVHLEVAQGEFVVLVGPSGCGKSTLLRMIAGLEEISEGTLAIDGTVVNEVPARLRDVAMVFQNYALYPHMDVRRNMAFGLMRRRRHGSGLRALLSPAYRAAARLEQAGIDERVHRTAELLGIGGLLARRPGQLSGGQRQRVALGRAIVREPRVFLFDEPLSNLDAKLRHEMRVELRQLHRRLGATMIYVTHDQEEAMGLGDRIVVLRDGVVQQAAPPAVVYRQPANSFTASFVGSPAMNFARGTLERRGADAWFLASGVRWPVPRPPAVPDGAAVVLGLRPDALRPAGPPTGEPAGEPRLEATVISAESLGDRVDLALQTPFGRWTCRTPGATPPATDGAVLGVVPGLAAAHWFAADEAGARLPE